MTIDLGTLFNEYWSYTKHEFTVPSQSCPPTRPLISDRKAEVVIIGKYCWSLELRFSAHTTVRLLVTAHPLTNAIPIGEISAVGAP